MLASTRRALQSLAFIIIFAGTPVLDAASVKAKQRSWPRGKVFVPKKIFQKDSELDTIILESNPRLYLHPEFDPSQQLILVIGMPGWGGRSENFIGCLHNGLKGDGLESRLVLASIQDPGTRGPRYQGQGGRANANLWRLDKQTIQVMRHFIVRLASEFGHLKVYFMGFSTGSVIAPLLAVRVGARKRKSFQVEGAICLGTGSGVRGFQLKQLNQRLLLITVPPLREEDKNVQRADQHNRHNTEQTYRNLKAGDVAVTLHNIKSVRRHIDWHWGLMSQCRYFPNPRRIDDGRGYWPNYWLPNPDTFGVMSDFISGKEPAANRPASPPTKCPHDPDPGPSGPTATGASSAQKTSGPAATPATPKASGATATPAPSKASGASKRE